MSLRSRWRQALEDPKEELPAADVALLEHCDDEKTIDCSQLRAASTARFALLNCNSIRNIQDICTGQRLVLLDLHKNQIDKLPDYYTWEALKCLRILLLHSNRISSLASIDGLVCAIILHVFHCIQKVIKTLNVITLYDNPVALHKQYRPFIANTLPALMCIDDRIISDEELIEGMHVIRICLYLPS